LHYVQLKRQVIGTAVILPGGNTAVLYSIALLQGNITT